MKDESIIPVPQSRFEELLKTEEFMRALEAAGVDNWEGYDYAIDILNGDN